MCRIEHAHRCEGSPAETAGLPFNAPTFPSADQVDGDASLHERLIDSHCLSIRADRSLFPLTTAQHDGVLFQTNHCSVLTTA